MGGYDARSNTPRSNSSFFEANSSYIGHFPQETFYGTNIVSGNGSGVPTSGNKYGHRSPPVIGNGTTTTRTYRHGDEIDYSVEESTYTMGCSPVGVDHATR